jgi:hypothetical protein
MSQFAGYFYYKGGLIHIDLPTSIASQLTSFSNSIDGAISTVSFAVPQDVFSSKDSEASYRIIAYVFTALSIIALVIVVALRRSIAVAIKAIKMGAAALQDLPTLVWCVCVLLSCSFVQS